MKDNQYTNQSIIKSKELVFVSLVFVSIAKVKKIFQFPMPVNIKQLISYFTPNTNDSKHINTSNFINQRYRLFLRTARLNRALLIMIK